MNRVVVTGVGAISPVGLTSHASFDAVVNGHSGIERLPFAIRDSEVCVGGLVEGFDPVELLGKKKQCRVARFTQLAIAAADEAVGDAASLSEVAPSRIGVIVGVGFGGLEVIEAMRDNLRDRGARAVSPYALPSAIANAAAAEVAIRIGAGGPCFVTCASCASGAIAITQGVDLVRSGAVDIAVVGGAEAAVTSSAIAGFDRLSALARGSATPQSRPFDLERTGFVIGEGAAMIVLEAHDRVRAARRSFYAEISGYGLSCDAQHMTRPAPGGARAANAMTAALQMGHANPDEIQYINAHGTGTRANDVTETQAIKSAFGNAAEALWISSTKSMTAHLLGAAGALETVFTALAINRQTVPPTINLETADPDCDLDYVPTCARRGRVRLAMTNSFGFGGHNCSLLLRSPD